jgi:hypothetical protein
MCFGEANSYYVSPTGSDSNPGTLGSPWKTLAKAASSVSSGDTVYLRAATWNEKLWFSSKNYTSYVTFRNYPGESPILDGTGLALQYEEGIVQALNSSYIRVQGLHVQNSPNAGMDIFRSHHVEFLNNYTWNTRRSGVGLWYANDCAVRGNDIGLSNNIGPDEPISISAGSYNIEVSYNTVHHGASIPDGYAGGEGINVKDGCHDVYVHHNVVHLDDRPDGKPSNRYAFGVDAWPTTTGLVSSSRQKALAAW